MGAPWLTLPPQDKALTDALFNHSLSHQWGGPGKLWLASKSPWLGRSQLQHKVPRGQMQTLTLTINGITVKELLILRLLDTMSSCMQGIYFPVVYHHIIKTWSKGECFTFPLNVRRLTFAGNREQSVLWIYTHHERWHEFCLSHPSTQHWGWRSNYEKDQQITLKGQEPALTKKLKREQGNPKASKQASREFYWMFVAIHVPRAISSPIAHLGHAKQSLERCDKDEDTNTSLCVGPTFS